MAANDSIFADTSRKAQKEREAESAQRFADLRKSLTRLCANDDFRSFYQYLAYEFCGADFGRRPIDEVTQGVRLAMSKINEAICIAEGGPELIAHAAEIHFKAMGDSIVRERTKPQTGER